MSEKPKRRWYQFSLKATFVAITALAVALGYVMYERHRAFRFKAACQQLKSVGVETHYQKEALHRPEWLKELLGDDAFGHISFARFRPGRALESNQELSNAVDLLSEFQHLRRVIVNDPRLDDDGFTQLCRLQQLDHLFVGDTQVTDKGLASVELLNKLGYLHLGGTKITDEGLRELRGLKDLGLLNLKDTKITNTGLRELATLKQLRALILRGTQVTDAGLTHLHGNSQLEYLDVVHTKVTNEGVAKLKKALPYCEIIR